MIRPVNSVHRQKKKRGKVRKREREEEREGDGSRWRPAAAVGGLPSPVSLDRAFKRVRKREPLGGEEGTYRTVGASVARPSVAGEPTPTA